MGLRITTKNVNKLSFGNFIVNGNMYSDVILSRNILLNNNRNGAIIINIPNNELYFEIFDGPSDDIFAHRKKFIDFKDIPEDVLTDVFVKKIIKSIISFNEFNIELKISNLASMSENFSIHKPMGIPVTVVGGRKYKGSKGILLYGTRVADFCVYGRQTYSTHPVILDIKSGELIKPNSFSYIKIDDDFYSEYKNLITSFIIDHHNDYFFELYKMCKYHIDSDNTSLTKVKESLSMIGFDENLVIKMNNTEDLISAFKTKRENEFNVRKEQEMPNIINWVKEHTDKKGDDILKLAEHIFNKRNSIDYSFRK